MSVSIGRRGKRPIAVVLLTLLILGALGGLGLAASAGGGAEGGQDDGALTDLLYRFVNFALLVAILVVVVRKTAVKNLLSNRREEIARKMEDLRKAKEETESRCRELERQVTDFEARKGEILGEYRAEGLKEKERIIAEGKERAAQVLAQADLTIQREIQAAQQRLRQEVVDAASRKAQEIIASEIGDKDQDNLISEFIDKVGKLH